MKPHLSRDAFFRIRLARDPEQAYEAVCRILAASPSQPDLALAECSEWVDGFGVESLRLADGSELFYVNKGEAYEATLCYVDGSGFFVSSWGDVYEQADRDHEEETDERRCAYCSEWAEPGEACGSCGRDPESGDSWLEPHAEQQEPKA